MRFPKASAAWCVSLVLLSRGSLSAQSAAWDTVDRALGARGKDLPGEVHRFGWPRTDLRVRLAGVEIEPALALGSWAAFKRVGSADDAIATGDLVLLGREVDAVVGALQKGGLEVLAIHNHLIEEEPRVVYVHFHGHGNAAALAAALKAALATTSTPLTPGTAATEPSASERRAFDAVEAAIGRKGSAAGRVLQMGVPRRERIEERGVEIPPSMGMAIAMNFQAVGSNVASTGDFVLVADEVDPVIRELRDHGMRVTALHSHMLRETPRLFFLHFWGVAAPEKIGEALKSALAKTGVQ